MMTNKEIKLDFRGIRKTLRQDFKDFVKGKTKADIFADSLSVRAEELNKLAGKIKEPADPNKCLLKK